MPHDSWPEQVERRVARWAASAPGRVWVVAVSGGGDSVGLLRVLHAVAARAKGGLALSVAHFDHGTRGEASRADAEFVRNLASSLGLPCDVGRWEPTRAGHFEADARRARYAWLLEVARRRGATAVAVGHTRDDQAETVLHRVIRGTGVHGLAGIPARRPLGPGVTLVRPLLGVSREEVRGYLERLGQPFRDDASNADTARTRARIRHELLPALAAGYNPKVADALVNLARLAAGSSRAYRRRVRDVERYAALPARGELRFSRDRLMRFPAFVRAEVLRASWRRAGWPEAGMGATRWRRLALLARRTREGRYDVGGGVEARSEVVSGSVHFVLRRSEGCGKVSAPPEAVPLELPGSAEWPGGRVALSLDADVPRDETIDLDRVFPPLVVRGPVPGDRFAPLGMGGRETPLNDFFRGRRVPREDRARTPLVCDRLGIVWVVGHRIADRVRLTEATARRGALRWEPAPAPGAGCG